MARSTTRAAGAGLDCDFLPAGSSSSTRNGGFGFAEGGSSSSSLGSLTGFFGAGSSSSSFFCCAPRQLPAQTSANGSNRMGNSRIHESRTEMLSRMAVGPEVLNPQIDADYTERKPSKSPLRDLELCGLDYSTAPAAIEMLHSSGKSLYCRYR